MEPKTQGERQFIHSSGGSSLPPFLIMRKGLASAPLCVWVGGFKMYASVGVPALPPPPPSSPSLLPSVARTQTHPTSHARHCFSCFRYMCAPAGPPALPPPPSLLSFLPWHVPNPTHPTHLHRRQERRPAHAAHPLLLHHLLLPPDILPSFGPSFLHRSHQQQQQQQQQQHDARKSFSLSSGGISSFSGDE